MKKTIDLLNEVTAMGFNRERALADIDASLDNEIGFENSIDRGLYGKGRFCNAFFARREKDIYVPIAAFFHGGRNGPFSVPVEQLARHEYINSRKRNDERTGICYALEGRSLCRIRNRRI